MMKKNDHGAELAAVGNDTPVVTAERQAHTPGPWTWFDYPDGRRLLCAPARLVVFCPDAPMDVDPPDAQLIAAAPDLLSALSYMVNCFDAESTDVFLTLDPVGAIAQARAAIAKAEGTAIGSGTVTDAERAVSTRRSEAP